MHKPSIIPVQARLPLGLEFARRLPLPHQLGLLDRIYGRALEQLGTVWVKTWNGKIWKLDMIDVNHRWIVYGVYEGSSWLAWLKPRLKDGGVVIESGANIGQTLMYYADLPGIEVFAFEPNTSAADWLQDCLNVNPELRTQVIRCGLASEEGKVELQLAGARSTMINTWYRSKSYERVSVPVIRLDEFAQSRGIQRIIFWKLDVEGFEAEALAGASSLLSGKLIDAMMIEAVGNAYRPVKQLLEEHGYRVFCIGHSGDLHDAPENLPSFQNVVALPDIRT
jgi:FkbM family methyltransferase